MPPATRPLHPQRRLFQPLALSACLILLLPFVARADLHDVTITGSILGLEVPQDFSLNDPDPVDGSETFTLTFRFDDAAPLSGGNGTTISEYAGAISDLALTISNGLTLATSSEGVLAADNGSNHQWSVFVFTGSAGFSSNLPDPLSVYNSNADADETFVLQTLDLALLDLTASVYSSSPPELVVPGAQFDNPILDVTWQSVDSGEFVRILTSVSSVSSAPVGAAVPALGLPAIGLLVAGAITVAGGALRRRERGPRYGAR